MFKKIIIMGVLVCDGNCAKAWGIQARPRTYFKSEEEDCDDHVYLPDSALPLAPAPGKTAIVSEGSDMKPSATGISNSSQMNKWCSRQCERSHINEPGQEIFVPDLEHPRPNVRSRWISPDTTEEDRRFGQPHHGHEEKT